MGYSLNIKDKTVVEQMVSIKRKFANFDVSLGVNSLCATGELQPTSRSNIYTVRINYHFKKSPEIYILKPQLVKNFKGDSIPHVYPNNRLCLFQPKYKEFKYVDFISDTIIPWTSLWLYYYEIWHATGDWLGGGEHPQKN